MANLRGPIARGEKSGAFALGFSDKMKSVAGAMAVLALATTGTVVVQAQTAPAALAQETDSAAPAADPVNQIIDADMIASGRVTKAANLTDAHGVGKGLISGHVYLATPGGNPGAAYDNGNVKMDGITVYAQFRDKDGSYSPIFSAKTHTLPDVVGGNGGQGTFAFGTGDKGMTWTDKLGNEHTWSARTDQQHRIWVEPFTNDRGNRVEMFRQANGWTPGSFNGVVDGPMGSFVAADGNMQLMAAFLREIPPNHKESWMAAKGDKLVEDTEGPISAPGAQLAVSNTLSGQVWLETGGSPDWGFPATGPKKESKDPAAAGYTVFASTLTREGAAANAELHAKFKNDPDKLSEETKKMLEAHPEYILKTVYGKTDNKGNYSLRFGNYTDKSQTREDFLDPNHVFVWVENKDGVVQSGYTGFHTPIFQRFNEGGNFKPADAVPAENQAVSARVQDMGTPRYGKPLNNIYSVRHAVMPYAPVSIKADYNATDKPASPGVTVTPEFSGELSSLPSKIEWRDKAGKVAKTCELDQSKTAKDQVAACTFEIPAEAQKGDVYNVVVVSGNNDVAAWSVLVTSDTNEFDPKYEDSQGAPGTTAPVEAPTFTKVDEKGNPTDEKVDAPEGTKFSTDKDGVEVAEDGSLKVQIPADATVGDVITVPVTVTYPDGTTDEVEAKVTVVADGDGDGVDPDPDGDNDGVADDPNAPEADSQKVTFGVKIDDEIVKSDGNNETAEELPESLRGVVVTLKAEDGTEFKSNDNSETWRGAKGYPVVQNFGLKDLPKGKYTVSVAGLDDIENDGLKLKEDSQLRDGAKVEITGNTPNLFVEFITNENKQFQPAYEDKLVVPGKETKSTPEFKDQDGKGKKVDTPEGSTFAIGKDEQGNDFKAPEGYEVKIDENTGEITVTFPDKSNLDKDTVEEFEVPVTVTYPDESTDDVKAKFQLDTDNDGTPDVDDEDDDGDGIPDEKEKEDNTNPKSPNHNTIFEPGYEDGKGKPGEDVTIPAPEFKDKEDKPTFAPDGTTFSPGEGAPDYVKIDENTGEITVTIPEDATPGDEIKVPVVVTYPDGTKDNVDVTVTVEKPDAPDAVDPQKYPEDTEVEKGGSEKITPITPVPEGHTPKLVDQDGKPTDKVVVEDENGKITVEIDEDGVITVTPDENATPGDYKIPVVNVDENGDPIEGTEQQVPVKVTEKGDQGGDGNNTGDDAVKYTPTWKNAKTKPAVPVDVKNERPDQLPEGSKVEAQSDKGWTVTTAPDGTITVTPPADAQHGDKSEISVTVTYPDGSQDQETFTVTVETDPSWEDGKTTPDKPIVIPNDGGPVKPGTTVEVVDNGPGTVEIDDNGNITVAPKEDAKTGDKVVVVVKDPEGNEIDRVTVEIVDNPDDVAPTNPNTDPKGNQADDVTPDWENQTVKPGGTVDVPNKGDKLPDGSKIETEVSKNGWTVEADPKTGELKVTAPKDAKHGDKVTVTVTVTYPDGSKDTEKFTVTVVEKKDGSTPPGSSGSSDLPDGLIPGLIGGGIIGGLIGSHLGSSQGSSHGSSTPGHGAGKAPADKGAQQGAGNQGGNASGQSGKVGPLGGKSGAQSGASSSSADRQGSLAVTGVSGVAIMLGAAAMALAIGGALLAGRRRREN